MHEPVEVLGREPVAGAERRRGRGWHVGSVPYDGRVLPALGSLAVLLAAFVKGSIGFGFPTLGTPLLSLVTDVQTAVVLLIVPNITMDGLQLARLGTPRAVARRFAALLVTGAAGTLIGTRLLVGLSPHTATLILGAVIVLYVAASITGLAPRVAPRWEGIVSPVVGFVAGVVGGVTNVPGTPLVMYFNALGLAKREFVAAVAFTTYSPSMRERIRRPPSRMAAR